MKRFPYLVIVLGVTLTAACKNTRESTLDFDRAPPEVGGRFSIGGFELLKPAEDYGYQGEFSASEQALRERSRKFDRTVWQAVILGAVGGTAIGLIAGGDAEDAIGGAIVGASLGALAGMYVANKQKQYAGREAQIQSMTADVRDSNRELAALIAEAESVIAADKKRLANVQARYARGKATESELKQERARIWSNRDVAEKAAQGARDQYIVFKQARQTLATQGSKTGTQPLDREIERYQKSIDALDRIVISVVKA